MNFLGKVRAPFGVNSNVREGNLGRGENELTKGKVATAAAVKVKGGGEQVIGREGETATFLSRRPLNPKLRVFGFAPRQFNRYVAPGEI